MAATTSGAGIMKAMRSLMLVGLLLSALAAAAGDALPSLPVDRDARFLGVDTCGSSECHGSQEPWRNATVSMKERLVWQAHDPHAKAYEHLAGEDIALPARIVSLVNRFDNLCNPPLLALAMTPHEALSHLFANQRSKYDATVLNLFIRMMGVYPAGSVVQLTDGRFALVISVNAKRPLKPRVLVFDPAIPRDEALDLDLDRAGNLGIRRSLRAAQLPDDARDYLAPRPQRLAYFFEPGLLPVSMAEAA